MPRKLTAYPYNFENLPRLKCSNKSNLKLRKNYNYKRILRSQKLNKQKNIKPTFCKAEFKGFLKGEHRAKNAEERILKNISPSNNHWRKYNMAVEFDHMYSDCPDSKSVIERDIEIKKLKEINLLHLEYAQQLEDINNDKDKLIKALQEDNRILRAKLERIDRRVSMSHQKKGQLSPISVQTDFPSDFAIDGGQNTTIKGIPDKNFNTTQDSLKSSAPKSPKVSKEELAKDNTKSHRKEPIKRLSPRSCNLSPVSPNNSLSLTSISNHMQKISPKEKKSYDAISTDTCKSDEDESDVCRKLRMLGKRANSEQTESAQKKQKTLVIEGLPQQEEPAEAMTDHSLRSRDKLKDTSPQSVAVFKKDFKDCSNNKADESSASCHLFRDLPQNNAKPIQEKLRASISSEVPEPNDSDSILLSFTSYHLYSQASTSKSIKSNEDSLQQQIEIPKWRTKCLSSLYVMEGTENLEDEIFMKRHSKSEHDERRRKRWDLQRMREQRQYEKLRERYEGRNNPNDSHCGSQQSLWPNVEGARYITVEDHLPLCAFGQVLPQIPAIDFTIPWMVSKSQSGNTSRKKKN